VFSVILWIASGTQPMQERNYVDLLSQPSSINRPPWIPNMLIIIIPVRIKLCARRNKTHTVPSYACHQHNRRASCQIVSGISSHPCSRCFACVKSAGEH